MRPSRLTARSFGILCLAILAVQGTDAAAALGYRAFATANFAGWTIRNGGSVLGASASPAFGGGIGMELPLSDSLTFDFGAQYVQRKYAFTLLGVDTTRALAAIELPIGLRWWIGESVSLAGGGYFAVLRGPVTEVAAGAQASRSLTDIGMKNLDYGVQASLAYVMALGDSFGLWLEGRYLHGFANVATDVSSKAGFEEAQASFGIVIGGRRSRY